MSDPEHERNSSDAVASAVDDALLRPVRAGNAFEETVARLLQAIKLGMVAPREALPSERELAARLGVSRDTVREALRSLAGAGWVVARRGRYGGTFISDPLPVADGSGLATVDAAEIENVLVLREILETGAARAAASRSLAATERDLIWTRLQETAAASVVDYRRLDSRLHLTIAELAGSPSLVSLVADNRMQVNELLDCIPLLDPNIAHSNQQHEAIVIAILAGDSERAGRAMREHLDGSAALLKGFLG